MKVVMAFCMLQLEFRGQAHLVLQQFNVAESLRLGAIPAAIYAVQNLLCQVGYRHLDFLSFNLLNQTKMLSTAAFVYLLIG
jgi:UDP-sugar transporter A1/2/3